MTKHRFPHLWSALDAALKEKGIHPSSTRLTNGVGVLVTQERAVWVACRDQLDKAKTLIAQLAQQHNLPAALVASVVGYNRDEHAEYVARIEELDLLQAEIDKATA